MDSLSFFIKKITIPFFVFVTGACVLIIEIVAIRILAPYYGNTIFSVSSVISVVLAALSCGYYFGGKLADKHPKEKLFFLIIELSGIVVVVFYLFGIVFLEKFGYKLSIVEGPIITSLLLFFGPNFLLGMLSPFAVKLQTMRLQELGVGSASGQIFFWSTLGSIFGSLIAGFLLLPMFGQEVIMLEVGLILTVMGSSSRLAVKNTLVKSVIVIVFLIGNLFFINIVFSNFENKVIKNGVLLYNKDALYQKILVYDGLYKGKPTRFLFQDKNASAAAFLDSPELPYEYTKYYILYQVFNPKVKQALAIGAGAYSVPKALLSDSPEATVDVSEIEPVLVDIGKEYFNVPDDPRLNTIIKDGRRALYDTDKKYDLIFSDAYASFFSSPSHLTTQEFFDLAKNHLTDKGVFIANVAGSLVKKPQSFALSEIKTFKQVFENSYFFAVSSPESDYAQNLIFVGYNDKEKIDFNSPAIKNNKNPIISNLADKEININNYDFSNYPLLTDDYSPVDYLISKEFKVKIADE